MYINAAALWWRLALWWRPCTTRPCTAFSIVLVHFFSPIFVDWIHPLCPSLYYFRFYVFEPKSNYRSRSFITLPSMRFESPSDNLGLWIFRNIREFRKFTPWKNPGSGNSRICSTYHIGYLKMSVSDYRCTGLSKRTMKYYNNMNLHRHKLTNVD